MFNSIILAKVEVASNMQADKNGNSPFILRVLAGKSPNRFFINGTIGERMGLKEGTFLLQVSETEPDEEFGRQFAHTVLAPVTPIEIVTMISQLGEPEIFSVDDENSSENESTISSQVIENQPKLNIEDPA